MTRERLVASAYHRAPAWLQTVAVSAQGLVLRRQRFGGDFPRLLREAESLQWLSAGELEAYRCQLWERMLRSVVARLDAYGWRNLSLSDVPEALPVLRKARVVAEPFAFINDRVKSLEAHTSGTTGAGLRFRTTRFAIQRQWAYWWRYRRSHGIPLDEWCGVFGGREICAPTQTEPPFWRVNWGGRSVMFSQYHLSVDRVALFLSEIRRRKLRWLHGYPSVLALLSQVGIDLGLAGSVNVKWVTVGAENLLSHQRMAIRRMFGVLPRQHYGLAEAVANISECPDGKLHIDEDFSLVEFVPDAERREGFRLIGTTLDNDAMPLVRYDTGDLVRVTGDRCGCGRNGRVVDAIDGRQEDYVILSDGTLVGRVDHLFKDAVNVAEAQIVQELPGEAAFRIVRGGKFRPSDEQSLREEATRRFGQRLRIRFEYVDALPRSNTGKLRLVVSTVPRGSLGVAR